MSGEIEKVGGSGTELVSMGYALIRAENDALQRVAVDHARNPQLALAEALEEFNLIRKEIGDEFLKDYATKGYYSIPYDDGEGGKTHVEGLSVRSMERLMRIWGRCSVSGRFLNEDESGFDVAGVAIDFQTGWRLERTLRVSKYTWRRRGGVVLLSATGQAKAVQIGISKACRNAGLAILPDWLRMIYFKRLKEIAAGPLDKPADKRTVAGLLLGFQKMGVTKEMLEGRIGRPVAAWTGDDVGTLIGLGSAIRDKETTVEEAFGDDEKKPAKEDNLQPETLVSGTVTAKNDAQRDREKQDKQQEKQEEKPEEKPAKPSHEPTDEEVAAAASLFDFDSKDDDE